MCATERELRSLVSQYTADPMRNINPFSMRLQGTIDANVQGGITKYEQVCMWLYSNFILLRIDD